MDYPLAAPVKDALLEAIELDDTGYANPAAGGLGAAFAGFAGRRLGWAVDPAQVAPLNDVVDGIAQLLRVLTEPGDAVIINPPVYHPFFSLIAEVGRAVVEAPLRDGRELDLEAIERGLAAGARALVLCNPHNPTGEVLRRDELEAVAELAARHEAWVLADEIHGPLVLAGAEHVAFTSVSDAASERGIVLTSASKAFNVAGLKCALAVTAGAPARAALERLPAGAGHCGHLGVIASVAAFERGDAWLDAVLELLDSNRDLLAELLAERLPEVRCARPAAGYLAWLDCSALGLGDDPAEAFLERGRVALSGGPQFGAQGRGFVRLNYATSPALLADAVGRMAATVGR
ncbi:MAG: aminotransferase class I/II-fold pyridoxal phosphate-dependent enzyme [Solirubrobacterales bacterium]|nr:aminotransferase class I/II-fold pyridoxal phosphate-dependent enzyme [Solirubrobacterales bacterium]